MIDHGLYIHVAQKLAESYSRVQYFCPWTESGFPSSKRRQIGTGIEGVERVFDLWDAVGDADLVVVTDVYYHDLVQYLREQGKPVWGAGKAEALEVERYATKRLMQSLGMNVIPYEAIEGVTALWRYVSNKEDVWIKGSKTRGDLETFHWINEHVSAPRLEKLLRDLGPRRHSMEFIVEPSIPGVEFGYDGYCVDGRFGSVALYGPEAKDAGYVGRVIGFNDLPEVILTPTLELAETMGKLGCRGFYSNEVRISTEPNEEFEIPAGTEFLIDPAMRCGSPPSECYSEDTEILTDEGWKLFQDLNRREKVATLNPVTKEIEYHRPVRYQRYWYDGELVNLTSRKRTVDLLVTPNHSVWAYTRDSRRKGVLKRFRADELRDIRIIPRTGIWQGTEEAAFEVPAYQNEWATGRNFCIKRRCSLPAVTVPMETWLAFLGLYLSEGSTGRGHVEVTQFGSRKERMGAMLAKLPFAVSESKTGFTISDMRLVVYVKQLGARAAEKCVPQFVKGLSPRLINIFLDAYTLGDGSWTNGRRVITTSSRQMVDDLQELFFKAGSLATYKLQHAAGTAMAIGDKEFITRRATYQVGERPKWTHTAVRMDRDGPLPRVPYRGYVYDVTAQNHILYVRRNGKPLWSGNSYIELFSNWDEVIWAGANGEVVDLQPVAKFVAQIVLKSDWVTENEYLPVHFDDDMRWLKLHNFCVLDGEYTVVPQDFPEFGSVIAIGDTQEQAEQLCLERAGKVEALDLDWNKGVFDEIHETITQASAVGIDWENE